MGHSCHLFFFSFFFSFFFFLLLCILYRIIKLLNEFLVFGVVKKRKENTDFFYLFLYIMLFIR